ncbi:MAG: hypothetical protein ABW047_04525 [Nitrospiraceae bacterium]
MNSIDVLTVLLSVVGVVAVTELAMWLYLMIHRTERNPFTFPHPTAADRTLPGRDHKKRAASQRNFSWR